MTTVNYIYHLMDTVDVSTGIQTLREWRNPATNKLLSIKEVNKLSKAIELLQVLQNLKTVQQKTSKSDMLKGIAAKKMTDLYNAVYMIINENKLPLPASRRIEKHLKNYVEHGATALLSKKRNMRNRTKGTVTERQFLSYLLSHPNRLDSHQIAGLYNYVILELSNDKSQTLTASAVRKIKADGEEMLAHLSGSQGKAGIRNLLMYRDRERPNTAMSFASLDGWDVELAFQDVVQYKNPTTSKISNRTVYGLRHNVVVVSDACIDFPLGWAIDTHETSTLIKKALRNAMRFVKQQTGKYYKISELVTDNFGSKDLKQSYALVAKKARLATVGNSNDKPIEAWFKRLNKRCQLEYNWTGYGNQATTKHNLDLVNKTQYKKMQPSKLDNIKQIDKILQEFQQKQLSIWLAMLDTNTLEEITSEHYLLALGEYRKARDGKKNETYRLSLSNRGIEIQRNGQKYFYQTFDKQFKEYALVNWNIIEDPENYNEVLAISKDGTLRFLLHSQEKTPMVTTGHTDDQITYTNEIEKHNKGLIKQIMQTHDDNYNAAIQIFEQMNAQGADVKRFEKLMPIINGQQKTYQKIAQQQKAIEASIPKTKETTIEIDPIADALSAF